MTKKLANSSAHLILTLILAAIIGGCAADSAKSAGQGRQSNVSDFGATKDPPLTADTHFAAGQLAESQGSADAAIAQYKEALKLDAAHTQSLYRLGVIYTQLKRFPEAIEAWKSYARIAHDGGSGWSNLAFCYELAGRNDEAEAAYQKGIERDPKSIACRVNYGLMLARHGHITQATLQFQQVLSPAEVHYNLASVFEFQGRKELAKEEYRKALQLKPDFSDAQARLSAIN